METHVFVFSCKFLARKHKNMRVSVYFLHLVLTFISHYITMDKGLLIGTNDRIFYLGLSHTFLHLTSGECDLPRLREQ